MLAPAVLFFMFSFAVPMAIAVRLSLFKTDYLNSEFVGFQNYIKAFSDGYFQKSFFNALAFIVFTTPALIFISYKIAATLSVYSVKTQAAMRFTIYLPALTSGIVMSLMWRWMLHGDGLINQMLSVVNLPAVPWMTEAWPARIAIALIGISGGIGGMVLIF